MTPGATPPAGPPPGPLARFDEAEREAALAWLLDACRRWLGSGAEEGPPPLGPPAPVLARMAWCHNLEPLLHLLGVEGAVPAPAPELAERWERAYFESVAFDCALLDRLAELFAECRKTGVPVLLLKGLATTAAWGSLGLRQASDVDLLCRDRDLVALCRVAGRLGYRSGGLDSVHDLRLRHPDLAVPVELHFDVYDLIAGRSAFVERALASRVELALDGRALPALAPETAAVFALAHLLHHDFNVNLRHLLDLAALLVRAPAPPDPASLRRELAAADLEEEMGHAAALLADLFGFAPAVRDRGESDGARATASALGRAVRRRLIDLESHLPEAALEETAARPWAARPRYLLRILLPPRRHLEALRALAPGTGAAAGYAAHLAATLHRGWHKLARTARARRAGRRDRTEGGERLSLKRRIYARRATRS